MATQTRAILSTTCSILTRPGKPYNSEDADYENRFERVYDAVKKFMKLCGINP